MTQNYIRSFLSQMKLNGNSEITIQTYDYTLKRFFSETGKFLNNVVHNDIVQWINRYDGVWKNSTIYSRLSILSSFFEWCIGRNLMPKNLIKRDDRPKKIKRTPRYLKEDELSVVQIEIDKLDLRDRLICHFFLSTGVRCEELQQLTIGDLKSRDRKALILGKNNKEREVIFSENCSLLFDRYIGTRSNPYEAIFLNKFGKQLSKTAIRRMVLKLGKKAGLSRRLTPHMFRHTFATLKIIQGYTLQEIADMLGHDALENTRCYAQILTPEIMTLYDRYMR